MDRKIGIFKERFSNSAARLSAFLRSKNPRRVGVGAAASANNTSRTRDDGAFQTGPSTANPAPPPPIRRAARVIDEDDYGDEDDEEEDIPAPPAPLPQVQRAARVIDEDDYGDEEEEEGDKADGAGGQSSGQEQAQVAASDAQGRMEIDNAAPEASKDSAEDAQAAEEAAKKEFNNYFYTLENDRAAWLEQQKLDAMEAQIEADTSGQAAPGSTNHMAGPPLETLSTTNLGATSLVMKNLFRRIDERRAEIKATDAEIRNIIRDVRKGRSKWASDDKVNQEELYEAAEQVLNSLKAETEYAGPFLQKVNKREAPDYYSVIKHPMDIGSMFKKLRGQTYKSKREFVDDLNLIWANCLKYNADPNHFLRKKALYMRKRSEELLQHVPDVVIMDRATFEAEERRKAKLEIGLEGDEESEEEEPLMASRGRKAPKKGNSVRKAPPIVNEGTPEAEARPPGGSTIPPSTSLRNEFLRPDSEAPADVSTNGFATASPGALTPLAPLGAPGSAAPGSQADASEAEGNAYDNAGAQGEEIDFEDPELKVWKLVTKKGRARVAGWRHQLFRGDKLNPDAPALLRRKAGMRRWLRHQKTLVGEGSQEADVQVDDMDGVQTIPSETIAEGMEEEEEGYLPDYYDTMSALPDLPKALDWVEDTDGNVITHCEETLRLAPKGQFIAPSGNLSSKMAGNMHAMQETRKICAKIGIVKQMQLQSQMYQNQFQKYNPLPLHEQDIEPTVVSDEGPIIAPVVCKAALQRTVAEIFYHSGYEEFQPSALDSATDLASNFFERLTRGLNFYREQPKTRDKQASTAAGRPVYQSKFTKEEAILHALHSSGVDIGGLEAYVKEDIERLGSKLGVMHKRMKDHLAELIRPALGDNAGADGVGAFDDGSDQFVGGDYAEELGVDFFGFKELGLDKEFGLRSLSVPLHLLQNRMHSAYQSQNPGAVTTTGAVMEDLPPLDPITAHNLQSEIGLVHPFFSQKLQNGDEPLVEDEELPVKQRFPKPRLPPTGKITSPRKRPIREQQQLAKKKRKLEEATTEGGLGSAEKSQSGPLEKKLRLEMPAEKEVEKEPEKDDAMGVISPPDSL
ncbi:hypothetical protein NA57DRAFT_42649 [Rhizodiscina lignyota]|uniref:Bromo domain-containing protein n=1 Tax=Rhizodiscina lignyota TaxID=1504668 RepID=A0A9P4IDA6_9PEZI|nr:hypothetical protein NA57DRAFT_42649 [Rhizodiscina lignyota]